MNDRTARFLIGHVVTASAGREAGCRFVVVGLEQDRLLLANGDKRTVIRPKRKSPCHVRLLVGGPGDPCLPDGLPLTDEIIRQVLRATKEEG